MCSGALVAIADINKDAFRDSLLIGNYYGVEIEITRYDAGNEPILLENIEILQSYGQIMAKIRPCARFWTLALGT